MRLVCWCVVFAAVIVYARCQGGNETYDDREAGEEDDDSEDDSYIKYLENRSRKLRNDVAHFKGLLDECKRNPDRKNNKTYFLRRKKVSWKVAYDLCKSEGKQLATIKNQEEQDTIQHLIKNDQDLRDEYLWIGGYYSVFDEQYEWVGEPKIPLKTGFYTNWAPGYPKPDNGQPGCVQTHGKSWLVMGCKWSKPYICEK